MADFKLKDGTSYATHSSHAHPYAEAFIQNNTISSLPQETHNVIIDVELRGLFAIDRSTVADIYCPDVRRSPFTSTRHVSHLDVVSSWKGLNPNQAAEVAIWKRLLTESLKDQVCESLYTIGYDYVASACNLSITTFVESFSARETHRFEVDLARLVHDTITLAYLQGTRMAWSVSGGDLPALVYNYIRTCDCFIEAASRPYIEARLSCMANGTRLHVIANINWHKPPIAFTSLPTILKFGTEYRIIPEIMSYDLGSSLGPAFQKFPDETEFLVSSKTLPFVWDPMLQCFRAMVPHIDASEPWDSSVFKENPKLCRDNQKLQLAETTFSAKIILRFPNSVRHERTTRYNIKLNINGAGLSSPCPDISPQTSSVGRRIDKVESQFTFASPAINPPSWERAPFDSFCIECPQERKEAKQVPLRSMFERKPVFEDARLALDQFEQLDLELNTKRQKLNERIDLDVHSFKRSLEEDNTDMKDDWSDDYLSTLGDVTTMCLGKALRCASPAFSVPSWVQKLNGNEEPAVYCIKSRAYQAKLSDSKIMPSLKKKGGVKRIIFMKSTSKTDSPQDYPTREDSASHASGSDRPLSQADIRNNYEKVLGNICGKDGLGLWKSSLDGTVSKNETNAFENIFLEGSSDEWATEGESLSETG